MGRIRNIKPDYFKHEKVVDLPRDIRLFFAGLWTQCDCGGVFEWRPRLLKIEIFPCDADITPDRIEAFLAALVVAGCVHEFTVGSKKYGVVHDFTSHQAISGKELKGGRRFPTPPPMPPPPDLTSNGTGQTSSVPGLSSLTNDKGQMTRDEGGQADVVGAAKTPPPPPVDEPRGKEGNREWLTKRLKRKTMAYDDEAVGEMTDMLQENLKGRSAGECIACMEWAVDRKRARYKETGKPIGDIRYARQILFEVQEWAELHPRRAQEAAP